MPNIAHLEQCSEIQQHMHASNVAQCDTMYAAITHAANIVGTCMHHVHATNGVKKNKMHSSPCNMTTHAYQTNKEMEKK